MSGGLVDACDSLPSFNVMPLFGLNCFSIMKWIVHVVIWVEATFVELPNPRKSWVSWPSEICFLIRYKIMMNFVVLDIGKNLVC